MGQSFDDIVAIFYQYQQICRSTAQMAMTYSRQKMIIEAATYYVPMYNVHTYVLWNIYHKI